MPSALRIILLLIVIIALPTVTVPLLSGVIGGIIYFRWHGDAITQGTALYLKAIDRLDRLSRFGVPGAPSFWSWQGQIGEPFHVQKLRLPDWHTRLGLQKRSVDHLYTELQGQGFDTGIDGAARLDGLLRDVQDCDCTCSTEFWVYISNLPMPTVFEWDAAFDDLVQFHNANPMPDGTELAYVDCLSEQFLCHIWEVTSPAMVHFKVQDMLTEEDFGMVDGQSFGINGNIVPTDRLRSVAVHVIDLPLDENSPQILPNRTFPSPKASLRALTTQPSEDLLEQFEEFHHFTHHLNRFNRYYRELTDRSKALDLFYDVDNWLTDYVTDPLGIESGVGVLHSLMFIIVGSTLEVVAAPLRELWDYVTLDLLGMPRQGDALVATIERRDREGGDGPFGGLFDFGLA